MLIGYARVSTEDQNLDLQLDALKNTGCEKIIEEKASGSSTKRNGLNEVLNQLRAGDTLVVWKLDRLGRSLQHLIKVVNELRDKDIYFKSIQESLDTSSFVWSTYRLPLFFPRQFL